MCYIILYVNFNIIKINKYNDIYLEQVLHKSPQPSTFQ